MGTYLSTPVTDKDTEEGEGGGYKFGASAMQGWRRSMEDEHIVLPSLARAGAIPGGGAAGGAAPPDVAMFAVFDGHGGKEVAKFCKKYMPGELAKMPEYQAGDFGAALVKARRRARKTGDAGARARARATQRDGGRPRGVRGMVRGRLGFRGRGGGSDQSHTARAAAAAAAAAARRSTTAWT